MVENKKEALANGGLGLGKHFAMNSAVIIAYTPNPNWDFLAYTMYTLKILT